MTYGDYRDKLRPQGIHPIRIRRTIKRVGEKVLDDSNPNVPVRTVEVARHG